MNTHFFDFDALSNRDRYKLLTATVVPRPIAWVTSCDAEGVVNAAPFSFFNVLGSDPAIIALGIGDRPEGGPKDTARAIRERGEFVVNLVPFDLAEAMNVTATDFPPGSSEIEAAGLQLAPCRLVSVPRIADSPVCLECREHSTLNIGRNRVIIGEVLALHLDEAALDPEKLHVDTASLKLIGRMGGAGGYTKAQDGFTIPRVSFAEWRARSQPSGAAD